MYFIMRISKKNRETIKNKFNGLCAYTGKPLGDDWQVDHMTSKFKHSFSENCYEEVNHIDNLLPAIGIVNHYKRSLDLEGFRRYMITFHNRLAKLPKKTSVKRTEKRIEYLNKIASLFNISKDKPFDGIFFFEKFSISMVGDLSAKQI